MKDWGYKDRHWIYEGGFKILNSLLLKRWNRYNFEELYFRRSKQQMSVVNEKKHSDSMNAGKMNLVKHISLRINVEIIYMYCVKIRNRRETMTVSISAEKLNKYF